MARLTSRQKQSQIASRSKAKRKKLKTFRHRLGLMGGVAVIAILGGGSWWLHDSGWIEKTIADTQDGIYAMTASGGFHISNLTIEGREKTSKEEVLAALGVTVGDSIFEASLPDIQKRIEAISTVKQASVERMLPDTLHVRIVERSPVAVWQHDGTLSPIDEEGVVLEQEDANDYLQLLVVVGKGAPEHTTELLELLATERSLADEVVAAVYVGERRWNLRFDSGVNVMLPEEETGAAWKRLAEMQREQGILQKSVQSIDMRLFERIFIKLLPDADPAQGGATET